MASIHFPDHPGWSPDQNIEVETKSTNDKTMDISTGVGDHFQSAQGAERFLSFVERKTNNEIGKPYDRNKTKKIIAS